MKRRIIDLVCFLLMPAFVCFLWVIFWTAIAYGFLIDCVEAAWRWLAQLIFDVRQALASWPLRWALALLPRRSPIREGIARGLQEQCDYERYRAFARIAMDWSPLPFPRWREVRHTLRCRPRGRGPTPDKYRRLIVREFAA